MSYTAPTTRSLNDLITPAIWNTDLVDNITYLKSAISAQFVLTSGMWMSVTDGATPPTNVEMATNKNTIFGISFPTAVKRYVECVFPLPGDYAGGTLTAKFYWTTPSAAVESVVWGLQGVAYGDGDARDAAFGTAVEVTDANIATAYTCRISAATGAITLAGTPAANELVH